MSTPTQNDIPSSTAADVRFNAEKLDEVVNSDNETYDDRFGNKRFTIKGLYVAVSSFFTNLGRADAYKDVGGLTDGSFPVEVGTDALKDSNVTGTIDVLLNSTAAGAVNLKNKKFVIPNSIFTGARWFRNRGTSATVDTSGLDNFSILGQGSSNTIIMHPGATGFGDHLYFDKAKYGKIGRFTLDNTALEAAGRNQNGQMWVTQSRDLEFDDIRFKGGSSLSFALGNCTNVFCRDLKVDFQYRYPVGTGKSPLIIGDFSQQCMIMGGWTKAVSEDGTIKYAGDLADNDDATDTKWAFHNFYGLTYSQLSNANVCLWQEGERARSNMHAIGNNYVGNGFGRGISQLSLGTDIGCSFNANQQAGIWARAEQWTSLGNHFLDITNVKGMSTGAKGAIWNEAADFISTTGNIFKGNDVDYSNYGTGTYVYGKGYFSLGDSFGGQVFQSASTTTKIQHQAFIGSRFDSTSLVNFGGTGVHNVFIGVQSKDKFGQLGNGTDSTLSQVNDIAFASLNADTSLLTSETGAVIALTVNGYARVNVYRSVISGFKIGIAEYGNGIVVYEKCYFKDCVFTAADLASGRFVDCVFNNCTNAPDAAGLNFKCDSITRPSSARVEVTVAAGGTYTFPSWVMEARGIYTLKIGGRGANLPYAELRIAKNSAAVSVNSTAVIESTAGSISAVWGTNGLVTLTFATAGTYYVQML